MKGHYMCSHVSLFIFNYFLLQNQKTGGQNTFCPGGWEIELWEAEGGGEEEVGG
jgi:hypothetical protein